MNDDTEDNDLDEEIDEEETPQEREAREDREDRENSGVAQLDRASGFDPGGVGSNPAAAATWQPGEPAPGPGSLRALAVTLLVVLGLFAWGIWYAIGSTSSHTEPPAAAALSTAQKETNDRLLYDLVPYELVKAAVLARGYDPTVLFSWELRWDFDAQGKPLPPRDLELCVERAQENHSGPFKRECWTQVLPLLTTKAVVAMTYDEVRGKCNHVSGVQDLEREHYDCNGIHVWLHEELPAP